MCICKTVWPSGLRRQTQVLVEQSAWVRTPQLTRFYPNARRLLLVLALQHAHTLTLTSRRGYGATVARLTPDQTVGRSNRSGLSFFTAPPSRARTPQKLHRHSRRVRDSIVVSISACHADDPGSIPGRGGFYLHLQHEAHHFVNGCVRRRVGHVRYSLAG